MHRTSDLLIALARTALLSVFLLPLVARAESPASPPLAELISTQTQDGVLLHGLHYRPSRPSQGVVIHIPGGAGSFFSVQDMSPLAAQLMAAGYHFLNMNTRTAGGQGFATMAYARFEDYRYDVAAAVEYAKRQGLSDIVLLGHSLGSARVLYYLAQTQEPAIRGVVLTGAIASPYLEAQMRWTPEQRAAFDKFLDQQRARVREGRGRELASYEWAPGRAVELSAASWLSIFGPPSDSNASTVKFAAEISQPVLLIHGDKDTTALRQNPEQIYAGLTRAASRELLWIEGADHLFRNHAQEYAQAVTHWVDQLLSARGAAMQE